MDKRVDASRVRMDTDLRSFSIRDPDPETPEAPTQIVHPIRVEGGVLQLSNGLLISA